MQVHARPHVHELGLALHGPGEVELGVERHEVEVDVGQDVAEFLDRDGALIIREACSGKLDRREIFYSMALMGICHSLVEDTLLMMALGGRLGGIFWGRILFSLGIVFAIVRLVRTIEQRKTRIPTGTA